MATVAAMWDELAEKAYLRWDRTQFMAIMPKISLPKPTKPCEDFLGEMKFFDGPGPWDRDLIEVELENKSKKVVIFSGNDYLGLSSHPAVRQATSKAALVHGMGPRASSMICGHTNFHRQLESTLAKMTMKEECVITPTGFAANNAFLSALGSIASLLATGRRPSKAEKIAVFSDALNHASIIDGLRLLERHQEADVFVYNHNNMKHLDHLLSNCSSERKVVITDSLFSMEGDFAPILELVKLRKKHGFLLATDDAHTTLVCGKNGGGIAEVYGIEDDIDVCIGTLSKATGCIGGFIACSKSWKKIIQSRGRSYIFTTALPVPLVAGTLAAIEVAKREEWRRNLVWNHVEYFSTLTKLPATSPIISIVVGNEESAFNASLQLLELGFHVMPIRPPAVPANACRLRITLSASHTRDDIERLAAGVMRCIRSSSAAAVDHKEEEEAEAHVMVSRL